MLSNCSRTAPTPFPFALTQIRSLASCFAYRCARVGIRSLAVPRLAAGRPSPAPPPRCQPAVETLEDRTAPSTAALVKDINLSPVSSNPDSFVNVNGTVFFAAGTSAHGQELCKTDGTADGTVLVKDIVPGEGGSRLCLMNRIPAFVTLILHEETRTYRPTGGAARSLLPPAAAQAGRWWSSASAG